MITQQQAFDKSVGALLVQNEQSWMSNKSNCAYRGDGGLKCAVGQLIPDDCYDAATEGEALTEYAVTFQAVHPSPARKALAQMLTCAGLFDDALLPLLMRLQSIHDGDVPSRWRNKFTELGEEFGLDTSVCRK